MGNFSIYEFPVFEGHLYYHKIIIFQNVAGKSSNLGNQHTKYENNPTTKTKVIILLKFINQTFLCEE